MIVFETDRLLVRFFTDADLDNFYLLNGNEEVMRYIRPAQSLETTRELLSEAIAKYNDDPLTGRLAVDEKESGRFVGTFAIIPVVNTPAMQLGYALLKEAWGKGYATELTIAGLHHIFGRTPLNEIYALTETVNLASQKVLLKAGFMQDFIYKEGEKEVIQFIRRRSDPGKIDPSHPAAVLDKHQ